MKYIKLPFNWLQKNFDPETFDYPRLRHYTGYETYGNLERTDYFKIYYTGTDGRDVSLYWDEFNKVDWQHAQAEVLVWNTDPKKFWMELIQEEASKELERLKIRKKEIKTQIKGLKKLTDL